MEESSNVAVNNDNIDQVFQIEVAKKQPAAWLGHTTVVQLLLERDDIDPNSQSFDGVTALTIRVEVV